MNLENTKENVLNEALAADLQAAFEKVGRDGSVSSIVLMSAKPNSFVAGADVGMLSKAKSSAEGASISKKAQEQFEKLERSGKPIVMLGLLPGAGGTQRLPKLVSLQNALDMMLTGKKVKADKACALKNYPITVMLGLLPGAGGTQRLPKLVSLQNALDMMLTGKKVKADKAKKIGLVDSVVQPLGDGLEPAAANTHRYLEEVAIDTARKLAKGSLKISREKPLLQKIMQKVMTTSFVLDKVVLKMARDKVR
ncbi:unnamed protein product [Strongylus vulgaris]|uniref:3-hydroxyacyl-CoA dehydrogenase NAD binding domain-containing protein n=1 Tax=Strongylus vulgaris TaxID=40348 RepID=A0A3P7JLP4_STRVU|nr:unnamed protein product [Strongylus vulgaris]